MGRKQEKRLYLWSQVTKDLRVKSPKDTNQKGKVVKKLVEETPWAMYKLSNYAKVGGNKINSKLRVA